MLENYLDLMREAYMFKGLFGNSGFGYNGIHEDALKTWCTAMGYTFSDKHEAGCGNWFDFIWIKELDIMKHSYSKCRDVSYGTRESACEQVLINAKAAHEEAERELRELCVANNMWWSIDIKNEFKHEMGFCDDDQMIIRGRRARSFVHACHLLIKTGKEYLKEKKAKTPHEDKLRAYCSFHGIKIESNFSLLICENPFSFKVWPEGFDSLPNEISSDTLENAAKKALYVLKLIETRLSKTPNEDALRAYCLEEGLIFTFADVFFSPGGIDGELQVWYPGHLPLYTCQWGKSFDSIIRTKEDACSRALRDLNLNDKINAKKAQQELEEFCRKNSLTIEPWCDGSVKISNGIRWYIRALNKDTLGDLMLMKYQGHLMFTESRMGPYERKVRELCERKGWRLFEWGGLNIKELQNNGVYTFEVGEPGFKEVWNNIQKLKELLA